MVSDRALTAQYPANSATAPLVPDGILTMNKASVAPRSRDSRSVSRWSRSSRNGRYVYRIESTALVAGPSDPVDNHLP